MVAVGWASSAALLSAASVTFVFTSDLHYGIHRGYFRGDANVEARVVNAALVRKLNALPSARLPNDGGWRADEKVGAIDFVIVTGDIANRQELHPLRIQPAALSWQQFESGFVAEFALKNARGEPAPLLVVPGNHDVSNAIGSPNKMVPATDASAMAGIYNRMMRPAIPRTSGSYRYETDKIQVARQFGGALCLFITMWPDRGARAWIEGELRKVPATMPVFIFCHDQPDIEAKHLTNPNGRHEVNSHDKFENVVADVCVDGPTIEAPTTTVQRELADFLKSHRNIAGYFHGNSNWNEFYTWKGPDRDLALAVFRADSPIKGKESGTDETKLSFQLVTYDTTAQTLTARECRWNAKGKQDGDAVPVAWGTSRTISLAPRAK